jgi:hypothetical protein
MVTFRWYNSRSQFKNKRGYRLEQFVPSWVHEHKPERLEATRLRGMEDYEHNTGELPLDEFCQCSLQGAKRPDRKPGYYFKKKDIDFVLRHIPNTDVSMMRVEQRTGTTQGRVGHFKLVGRV